MDKNLEKLEDDQEGARVLREWSSAGDLRSSALALERPRQWSNAPAFMCKRRRSIVVRSSSHNLWSSAPVRKAQSSCSPILKFLVIGFVESLLHKDSNPTIFRVFWILLESINRPVNTEKHTWDFKEELTTLKEVIFPGLFFSLIYFMKMISINIICN